MSKTSRMLETEKEFHASLLEKFKKELSALPAGNLIVETIRGKQRYYRHNEDGGRTYLPRRKSEELDRLIRKRYLMSTVRILTKNIESLEHCLDIYSPYDADSVALSMPNSLQMRLDSKSNDENNHRERSQSVSPNEESKFFPENLIHVTANGERVRSKSEAIIAGLLFASGIEYQYEKVLMLEGKRYYPDFTIRRPSDGKVFYWEHFGMVDDADYTRTMNSKLAEYRTFGITPWNNLLVTYDVETGIDVQAIQGVVSVFLLC